MVLTEEVGQHGEGADAEPPEGGGRGDVAVELLDHGLLAVAAHHHLLLLQLLGHLHTSNT